MRRLAMRRSRSCKRARLGWPAASITDAVERALHRPHPSPPPQAEEGAEAHCRAHSELVAVPCDAQLQAPSPARGGGPGWGLPEQRASRAAALDTRPASVHTKPTTAHLARPLSALAIAALLAACTSTVDEYPVERVEARPLELMVEAVGELKAVKSVPLNVPGAPWQPRQLVWMKDDGSRVTEGEVVARFSATQNELELAKALLDLQRNLLARASKESELSATQGRVGVDLAKVDTDLSIAQRYAEADLTMFARNEILDAIQDQQFLGAKQGVLEWRRDQASQRGGAELAVLDAQRSTFDLNARTRQQDLDALELRAPNDGVLVLVSNWSGEKPKIGASLFSGNEFATLPDASTLEVELVLPQLEAQGVGVDDVVELYPLGRPDLAVSSHLHWVASAPQQRGRGSPVRVLSMRAALPTEAATTHGWVPGQAFVARIYMQRRDSGISVPNVALISDDGAHRVMVRNGGDWEARTITLGARGPARSEVLDGLNEGDSVLLTPAALRGDAS
jgi:HlyD family secretion protein